MTITARKQYNVGGILLERPFKIRRLGHFGFNVVNMVEATRFYSDLLGFKISDGFDNWRRRMSPEQVEQFDKLGQPGGYFMRYGGDHHSFVLFNKTLMEMMAGDRGFKPQVTINQITWQVGSLAEVGSSVEWFQELGVPIQRTGRDMPGSNWHTYVYDPDGHTNEMYYGIEQVGWDGLSKPRSMYGRGFREKPPLPQISEFQEVQDAIAEGIDIHSGYRHVDTLPATYDVDGILLPRPFKITRIGPVSLFVEDVEQAKTFYQHTMGFTLTEEVEWQGHRCAFLRTNTEHHCLALYPIALRGRLGLSEHTTNMAFGVQLANYRQLREAVSFLRENGVKVVDVPAALYPGIDYAAHVQDPDGHCIQLYYYMEQVGWDGKPRTQAQRRKVEPGVWPEALEPLPDTYAGEPFLGPWG